jgi:hypothetical protein
MRYAKTLGLAVLMAAAVVAVSGTGSASATVLCKIFKQPCPKAEVWPAKTKVKATLEANTTLEIKDVHETVLATCTGSTIEGQTTNAGGGEGVAVTGINEMETFTGCTHTVAVLEKGAFEVRYLGPLTTGKWLFSNDNVTVEDLGATCGYGSGAEDEAGLLTSDETTEAELDLTKAEFTKISGSFICPPTVFFSGEYLITEPAPCKRPTLFIKKESI